MISTASPPPLRIPPNRQDTPPAEPAKKFKSLRLALYGSNPGYPTGTGSSVNLRVGLAGDRGASLQCGDGGTGTDRDDPQGGVHVPEVVARAPVVAHVQRHAVLDASLSCRGTGEPIDLVEGELRLIDVDGANVAVDLTAEIGGQDGRSGGRRR